MDDMGFIGHVITIFGARETYNLPKDYIKYNRNKNVPNTKTITARNPENPSIFNPPKKHAGKWTAGSPKKITLSIETRKKNRVWTLNQTSKYDNSVFPSRPSFPKGA